MNDVETMKAYLKDIISQLTPQEAQELLRFFSELTTEHSESTLPSPQATKTAVDPEAQDEPQKDHHS